MSILLITSSLFTIHWIDLSILLFTNSLFSEMNADRVVVTTKEDISEVIKEELENGPNHVDNFCHAPINANTKEDKKAPCEPTPKS